MVFKALLKGEFLNRGEAMEDFSLLVDSLYPSFDVKP